MLDFVLLFLLAYRHSTLSPLLLVNLKSLGFVKNRRLADYAALS